MHVQQLQPADTGRLLRRQMVRAFVSTGELADTQLVCSAMQLVQQWQAKRIKVSPVDTEKCRCCPLHPCMYQALQPSNFQSL